jgi:hypothetical protein
VAVVCGVGRTRQVLPGTEEALKCKARFEEEMRLKALKLRNEVRRGAVAPRRARQASGGAGLEAAGWALWSGARAPKAPAWPCLDGDWSKRARAA